MRNCQRAVVIMSVFAALCAMWPGLAEWVRLNVSAPATAFLARVSPFAAVLLIVLAVMARPRLIAALVTAAAIFTLTWAPVLAMPCENIPEASRSALEGLCHFLAEDLNAMGRSVPSPDEALSMARNIMNAPAAPRAAYFPGIMRSLSLAGIYIPVTGEAVVDVTRPEAGLVFTAAHELAHMQGIACEAAANIAAYDACVAHGGAAEYSAKLWALGYALGRLENAEISLNLAPEIVTDLISLPAAGETCAEYARLADHLANSQK